MKLSTKNIISRASTLLLVFLMFTGDALYSQPSCEDWLPNYQDNPYCHPYGGDDMDIYYGTGWRRDGNITALCDYADYGWGYWYESYTYYPYARIDYIAWHEKGATNPFWEWNLNVCEFFYGSYIYITGPAGEGGYGGWPNVPADPNVKNSIAGETWAPVPLKLGKTYTLKFISNDYLNSNYYTHFYWDMDDDKSFDWRGKELIQKWGGRNTNYGYCSSINSGTVPYSCRSFVNTSDKNVCFRGYLYGGIYNYTYTAFNHYWTQYEVDVETAGDGLVVGKPNRMRLKHVYAYNFDDPCQIYYQYGSSPNRYSYDYYGQIIDFDVLFGGIEIEPFPNEGTLTFANEKYNNGNRIPIIYQPGGTAIDFPKPSVTFVSPPSDILKMEYKIIGPRPSQTEIYRGTNSTGGTMLDVDPNSLPKKWVTVPDPNNPPNGTMQVERYYWEGKFTGSYDASTNGAYVKDANNVLMTDGSFFTAQSGEYAVVINFYENGALVEGAKDLFYNFTIKTSYDLTVQNILEPKPVSEPWFETHILNSQRQIKADVKNIGLNPINDFKVRYTIKGIDNNTQGISQTDMFTYDDQQYGTLDVDDIFTANFSKLFEGRVVGDYSVVVEVYDADGVGPLDKDQSHFNDYFPRPYGGSQKDGWMIADSYVIRFVYQHDLAAMKVIVPKNTPTEDVDRIYANRPFRPMVQFANKGQQDLAQEVFADLTIYRESDQQIVANINDYSVEYVPAGLRFNTVDVQFPSVVLKNPGRYRIEAHIRSIFEDPAARLIGNNTVIDYFDVEDGMQGVFTVGMLNAGKPKNFNTIQDAMDALYTFGMNGNITFELTDAQYDLNGSPAWDFTSTIIGLGYVPEANETYTMTWKASSNRAMIKGGVQINMSSPFGYGVKFGQGLEYPGVQNAPVNQSEDPNYINSGGHITFDGGMLKSLKFVMNSPANFSAPFYLGNGSQNIKLKNLIIENGNESLSGNSVRLPIIKGATTVGNEVEYTNDSKTPTITYSAGIVNRGQLFNFKDPMVVLPPKFDIEDIDTMSNINNEFTGNEISGFGYGIVSIGMGGLYDIQKGRYVNYNGTNNKINGNVIYNVARAGIAIGNEENTEIKGNHIYDVNTNDVSMNGTTDMFDHAGIMIGGLIYETETINGNTTKLKGFNVKNVLVDGNRVSDVQSDNFATGIKIEQNPVFFDGNSTKANLFMPVGESNVKVINNIVKDIESTDDRASRAGIHLFTQREYGSYLMPGDDHPTFRTMNDKISNNTIILTSSPNANTAGMIFTGIGIQQATNTDVSNNIIVIDDMNIDPSTDVSSAVFVQGQYSNAGGPNLDFNIYSVNPNSNAQAVRFIEMNTEDNMPKHSDWQLYKDEFTNLEQWRIVSGSDKHSIQYDAMQDLEIDGRDVKIKMTDGKMPIGSPLNNRGVKKSWYNYDINGNERGLTGQRFDIGALEFKGRQYTSDLELVRIDAPASYRSTVADPLSGVDFTDAEYIMTEGAIPVVAEVRNDGSLQQSDVELTLTIFRKDHNDELVEVLSTKKLATIPSSNEALVDFGMADGIGEDFKPQTYGFFNNDKDSSGQMNTSNDYVVDSRFVGMEANVTPIYVVRVETEADENNINNVSEKEVRFYLRKSDRYLMLSVTDNQGSLQSADENVVAGSMNTQLLKTALLSFNWVANVATGQYDYDVFDRNGWEKRSVNYDMYQTLVWSDGLGMTDGGNRFSKDDVRSFLASGLDINKKNLIIASQDMVKEADDDFREEVLRAEYEGNPIAGTYLNTPNYTVTGDALAKGRKFTVSDFTEQYLGADNPNYHPMASGLTPVNMGNNGTASVGFKYDEIDDANKFKTNAMGIATISVSYNTIYLGLDWRHFGNLTTLFAGVLDFIEANGAPIVPVELSDFNAGQQGNKVSIDWMTSSEVNSSRFEVERRMETGDIYKTIETVKAQGTSIVDQTYGPYFDYDVRYGNSYVYRLKMIDKDGSSEYSQERVVTMQGGEGNIEVISVGPNPLQTKSELRLNLSETMNVTIELYDIVGNQVSTIVNGTLTGGTNTIEINGNNLSNGLYNIVIRSGDIQIIEPITVVK